MGILDQRVIWESTDISTKVGDFRDPKASFVYTAGQHLYIGSPYPFNNLWVEMGTLNTNASVVSVSMYFGQTWTPAVDIIDETSGFTASGRLQWNTDLNQGWNLAQYSSDLPGFSSTFRIYNMYWVRLAFTATFSVGTTVQYIGQKFSTDTNLFSHYPDLNNSTMMTAFAAGKTDWKDQHFMAAEHIVRDLTKGGVIKNRSNLLDYSLFLDAGCHKVAEIVYASFGTPYFEQMKEARSRYKEAINLKFFNTDQDLNGRIDPIERNFSTNFVKR